MQYDRDHHHHHHHHHHQSSSSESFSTATDANLPSGDSVETAATTATSQGALRGSPTVSPATTTQDAPRPTTPPAGIPAVQPQPNRFYSERNPVPRIESYREFLPEYEEPPAPAEPTREELDARERTRRRKIEEHTKTVTDPVTGKECACPAVSMRCWS